MSSSLAAEKPVTAGTIALCPHKGCAYKCCDFQQSGSILLYPGEIEKAQADGHSVVHLQVLDSNYHGGTRVKCCAKNTATCDGGYKPLDCASYPLFPMPSGSSAGNHIPNIMVTKASGCPINGYEIAGHRKYVQRVWERLIKAEPEIDVWLRLIWLDFNDQTDPEQFELI